MPTNDYRYVLVIGARSGIYDEGAEILGPRVLGVFNYDDAHAAAEKAQEVFDAEGVKHPYGEPYVEVVHLGAVDPVFGIGRDAENWIATEQCGDYDDWGRDDSLCANCGFSAGEHTLVDEEDSGWGDDDDEDDDGTGSLTVRELGDEDDDS